MNNMSKGKRKCEILKAVRKQIADANGIPYEPRVCTYKGDCQGTCPACESEVRYLERELSACRKAGGAVKIAGLVSVMSLASCGSDTPTNINVPTNGVGEGEPVEAPFDSNASKSTEPCTGDCRTLEEWQEYYYGDQSPEPDPPSDYDVDGLVVGFVSPPEQPTESKDSMATKRGDDDEIMGMIVEKKAQFIGGNEALKEYLKENLKYPQAALDEKIQGTVLVKFVVDETGAVLNPQIIRSAHPVLDEEALRVVRSMGKWQPGEYRNEPVRSYFTLPITFKLKDDSTKTEQPVDTSDGPSPDHTIL